MKRTFCAILALLASTATVSAITVTVPVNGSQVTSPFNLIAATASCDSKNTVSMGYSLDNGATTVVPKARNAIPGTPYAISAMVFATDGEHVLHVKCWGQHGAAGDEELRVTIVAADPASPSNVTVVSNIQSLPGWKWNHDPATSGSAKGTSDIVPAPSRSGKLHPIAVGKCAGVV